MDIPDTELSLLEKIYSAEQSQGRVTQRELAQASGLSLGMTNALLKRLTERGWVSLKRLSTKTILYALTPAGVDEVARRATRYFQRAALNADRYREKIENFVIKAKANGATTLVLAGMSEMDFLIDYICERHGLSLIKSADREKAEALGRRPGVVLLFAESETPGKANGATVASLSDIIATEDGNLPRISGEL